MADLVKSEMLLEKRTEDNDENERIRRKKRKLEVLLELNKLEEEEMNDAKRKKDKWIRQRPCTISPITSEKAAPYFINEILLELCFFFFEDVGNYLPQAIILINGVASADSLAIKC